MPSLPPISSDMASEQKLVEEKRREWGFYLVSSNRELLFQMEKLMNREGLFGVMDGEGRVHYLVDARKGYPFAARQIFSAADRLIRARREDEAAEKARLEDAVRDVLRPYGFNRKLRGYRLLQTMLSLAVSDPSLLDPVSKRLYPRIAEIYGLTVNQVERNVRYLFVQLCRREQAIRASGGDAPFRPLLKKGATSLPTSETLRRLADEVRRALR